MPETKHVTITVTQTAELEKEVEVTKEELEDILKGESPILDECVEDVSFGTYGESNTTVTFNGNVIKDPSECFPPEEEVPEDGPMKAFKVQASWIMGGTMDVEVPERIAEQGDDAVFDYLNRYEVQAKLQLPDVSYYWHDTIEIDRDAGLEPCPDAAEEITKPSECFPLEEEERAYLEKIRAAFDEVSDILSDNLPDEDEMYAMECRERTDQAVSSFNDAYAKLTELLNAAVTEGRR